MSKALLDRLSIPKAKRSKKRTGKAAKRAAEARKVANPLSFLHMERNA